MHSFTKPHTGKLNTTGFSIIELMVTLSIVVLATGLVMVRYASFNSTTLLNSLAYQIAFDIRETQSLAVSVRGQADSGDIISGNPGGFREEYGMYFETHSPNQYILFQDNGDAEPPVYDEGEEVGMPLIIDPRFTIIEQCVENDCAAGGADSGVAHHISVTFARPNFDALIVDDAGNVRDSMKIVVGTDDPGDSTGLTRSIIVNSSGQISVE